MRSLKKFLLFISCLLALGSKASAACVPLPGDYLLHTQLSAPGLTIIAAAGAGFGSATETIKTLDRTIFAKIQKLQKKRAKVLAEIASISTEIDVLNQAITHELKALAKLAGLETEIR